MTVDLPLPGNRERDTRNAFRLHMGAHLPEDQPVNEAGIIVLPTMTWDDLAWLRSICPVPLVAKGILRADDAVRAVDAGCDGIWVSNHGGRQLDGAFAGIDALPEIVDGSRCTVRSSSWTAGSGEASTCWPRWRSAPISWPLGRPVLWGLAVDGAAGVQRILEIVRDELSLAMALAGCRTIGDITPDLVFPPASLPR